MAHFSPSFGATAVGLTQRAPTAYPLCKPHCTVWPNQLPSWHCAKWQVKKSKLPPNFLRKRARNSVAFQTSRLNESLLDNATRQLHQLSCILDSCTIPEAMKLAKHRKRCYYYHVLKKDLADLACLLKKLTTLCQLTESSSWRLLARVLDPTSMLMIDKAHVSGLWVAPDRL